MTVQGDVGSGGGGGGWGKVEGCFYLNESLQERNQTHFITFRLHRERVCKQS